MADNAAFETPDQQQGPESRSSDGARSGPFAAAVTPTRALLLHQPPPSPVPATMTVGDQHTDQDAAAGKDDPQKAPNAGAHALEDSGGQATYVGAGAAGSAVGPPADSDEVHMKVALVAAAKAAGDVSSVLLRSVGGDTAVGCFSSHDRRLC